VEDQESIHHLCFTVVPSAASVIRHPLIGIPTTRKYLEGLIDEPITSEVRTDKCGETLL
jgi:hypothetical protein